MNAGESRSKKSRAIVLRTTKYVKDDIIASMFSQEYGRISAIAKGARKISSRRMPHLQTGALLEVVCRTSHSLWTLQQTSLVSGFTAISGNEERMKYYYQVLFVLDRILPDGQPEEKLFLDVLGYVTRLAKAGTDPKNETTKLLNTLLLQLGYATTPLPYDEIRETISGIISENLPVDSI